MQGEGPVVEHIANKSIVCVHGLEAYASQNGDMTLGPGLVGRVAHESRKPRMACQNFMFGCAPHIIFGKDQPLLAVLTTVAVFKKTSGPCCPLSV